MAALRHPALGPLSDGSLVDYSNESGTAAALATCAKPKDYYHQHYI